MTPELSTRASLQKITFDGQSEFQRVQIIETGPFGKTLVLDGKTQSVSRAAAPRVARRRRGGAASDPPRPLVALLLQLQRASIARHGG